MKPLIVQPHDAAQTPYLILTGDRQHAILAIFSTIENVDVEEDVRAKAVAEAVCDMLNGTLDVAKDAVTGSRRSRLLSSLAGFLTARTKDAWIKQLMADIETGGGTGEDDKYTDSRGARMNAMSWSAAGGTGEDDKYTDSRGAKMDAMSWSAALTLIHELATANQISPDDVAHGDAGLEGQRHWQQIALDTLHDLVTKQAARIDLLNLSTRAGDWPAEALIADRSVDPTLPLNAIKIALSLAEGGVIDPSGADSIELADTIDEQQQALDLVRDFIGIHGRDIAFEIPEHEDRLVAAIRDYAWPRPLTTLELGALQGLTGNDLLLTRVEISATPNSAVPDETPALLRSFYIDDPDEIVLRFIDANCTGDAPAGIVLTSDNTIVVATPDRDEFSIVTGRQGAFYVMTVTDPLNLVDPEAEATHRGVYSSPAEALGGICEFYGWPTGQSDDEVSRSA